MRPTEDGMCHWGVLPVVRDYRAKAVSIFLEASHKYTLIFPRHPSNHSAHFSPVDDCLVLSREWGNGLWRLLLGIRYRDYYKDPCPHSLHYWGFSRDYYRDPFPQTSP